jgi:hypothetical protein
MVVKMSKYPLMPEPKYFIGLDIGQAQDYTALVVLERHLPRHGASKHESICHIPQITRFQLGTKYPDIVQFLSEKMKNAPDYTKLIVDCTGVGQGVFEMMERDPVLKTESLHRILITGGHNVNTTTRGYTVPKQQLVNSVQILLQTQRLKVKSDLPETSTLVKELQNFQVTLTERANDTYAGRTGEHDDLVLATALACWAATSERFNPDWTVHSGGLDHWLQSHTPDW